MVNLYQPFPDCYHLGGPVWKNLGLPNLLMDVGVIDKVNGLTWTLVI
jgi:hypothetical protein